MNGTYFTTARRLNPLLLLLILSWVMAWQAGCLKKPSLHANRPGEISLRIYLAENTAKTRASANDLQRLLILLKNQKAELNKEKSLDLQNSLPNHDYVEASFTRLYPGIWEIDVYGIDWEEKVIFQGGSETEIKPGKTNQVSILLVAGPGTLQVTLDASEIPGFGETVNSGRLYVYLDPESGRSTSFPLIANGSLLKGAAELNEGTYVFRVAVPQITGAVYISTYYDANIEAGKPTCYEIKSNAAMEIITIIDSTPATPTNLSISLEGDCVTLTWEEVNEADLAGYYIYRTNNEGRMVRIAQTEATAYTEMITEALFYKGCLHYAVSSFDHGGNESIWSTKVNLP